MIGYIWFVEARIVKNPKGKWGEPDLPKDRWYWSICGTPCDTRKSARIEEAWYKRTFPIGHYRIRRYERVEASHG